MTKKYFSIMTTMGKVDVGIEAEILYEFLTNTHLEEYQIIIQLAFIAHTLKPEDNIFIVDDDGQMFSQMVDPGDIEIIGDHTDPFVLWESAHIVECDEKGNTLE